MGGGRETAWDGIERGRQGGKERKENERKDGGLSDRKCGKDKEKEGEHISHCWKKHILSMKWD